MKKPATYLIVLLLLVLGLAVLFYPALSNWYNEQYHMQALVDYDNEIESTPQESLQADLERAYEYNEALTGGGIIDPFIPGGHAELPPGYLDILNVKDGMMGSIIIPNISVNLPIYHGTSHEVLEQGVGHMEMTGFPVGGLGNHTVLTGHTALPTATLFTDLDKVKVGDEFYIKVQQQILAYRVDEIQVVEPSDTQALAPSPNHDYITLITCTPYGINSHRLFVRGERVPFEGQDLPDTGTPLVLLSQGTLLFIAALALLVMVSIIAIVVFARRRKSEKKSEKKE